MASQKKPLSRRQFLGLMTVSAGATALAACAAPPEPTATAPAPTAVPPNPTAPPLPPTAEPAPTVAAPTRQLAVRFAHISDMHIEPKGIAVQHFSRAMRNVQMLTPPVEFVVNAGDCVMDAMFTNKDWANQQWDGFQSVLSKDFPLPVYHAIGNHDVWGWGLRAEEQDKVKDDPLFGKGLAMEKLGLTNRYYTFEQGGWRFIVLDSVHLADQVFQHPYTGKLDDEQYEWLVHQLNGTPAETPICIVSHIPVFGSSGLMDSDESSGNWVMPGAWQHIDGRKLIDLFWEHRNVKLCLSGHTHQVEDLKYHGVNYLTNGAISGNWWKGAYHDFPPGYVVFNLYTDGSVENEFIEY